VEIQNSSSRKTQAARRSALIPAVREIKIIQEFKLRHGGARPGAGRPPKGRRLAPAAPPSRDPVAYALDVMADPKADVERRDGMCKALLSYMRGGKPVAPPPPKVEDKWTGLLS
jgi:hypothetical protein